MNQSEMLNQNRVCSGGRREKAMNSCNVNYQRQEINLQKMAGQDFAITFKIDQPVHLEEDLE